jgi:hypothetical protein
MAGAGKSEQQELPAWLESLRAHDRPVPGGQESRQPFSLDELVDEDSMPSWMRQDRRRMPENGNSDSLPVLPPSAGGQEMQNTPAGGFQAGSLIDERSLPGWMREGQNQGQGGGQTGASQNVSAHSLVDQQSLPAWIKDLGQTGASQTPAARPYGQSTPAPALQQYGLPAQSPLTPPAVPSAPRVPQTPPASEPPAALAQGFSAHDLLDMQSMPNWMKGSQDTGQATGVQPSTRPVPTSQGFSAGELIDQRSVPEWMKTLQGQEKTDPQSAMGVPVNGRGQGTGMGQGTASGEGMPASGLLDLNSTPNWMREDAQNTAQGPQPTAQGMSAGSLIDMNAMPAWMRENQTGNTQSNLPPAQGMSANSLIDMNAMPTWMRNTDNAPAGPVSHPGQVPARPVPSRPRNELAPQEQSEAAANVFASMLGVSAPALPGQEQATHLGVAQGPAMPPFQQAQPGTPAWQPPAMPQYNQGAQPQAWQMAGANQPPMPNAYPPTGQQAGAGAAPARGYSMDQPAWGGFSAADKTALGVTSSADPGRPNPYPGNAQPTGTKKKGFFEAIRDFFNK